MNETVGIYKEKLRDGDREGAAWLLGYTEGKHEAYSSAVNIEKKQHMRNARDRLWKEIEEMRKHKEMMNKEATDE